MCIPDLASNPIVEKTQKKDGKRLDRYKGSSNVSFGTTGFTAESTIQAVETNQRYPSWHRWTQIPQHHASKPCLPERERPFVLFKKGHR